MLSFKEWLIDEIIVKGSQLNQGTCPPALSLQPPAKQEVLDPAVEYWN